jgi:hypothetical protein
MNFVKCYVCKTRKHKVDSTYPQYGIYGGLCNSTDSYNSDCLSEVLDNPHNYDNKTVDRALHITDRLRTDAKDTAAEKAKRLERVEKAREERKYA